MSHYKILKKNKDPLQVVYEKSGITSQFTLKDIEDHEVYLDRKLKELDGQRMIEDAKATNILRHNHFISNLDEEQLHAAYMYFESMVFVKEVKPKIKEVKDQIKNYKKEKEEIAKLHEAN